MEHDNGRASLVQSHDTNDDHSHVLSEDEARSISESVSAIVSPAGSHVYSDEDIDNLKRLLDKLLGAASLLGLSHSHTAAILNALCGLLDQYSTSADPQVRLLALNRETWMRAFHIILERSQNHHAKLSRRLLATLTLLLKRQANGTDRAALAEEACACSINAIFTQGDTAYVKLAIQVLEHFLRKHIIWASSMVVLASRAPKGISQVIAARQCKTAAAQSFILKVLEWLEYPDCVPAISRFLPVFVTSFEKERCAESHAPRNGRIGYDLPVWIAPVKLYHEKHPSFLETLGNQVLPHLLRLGERHLKAFLDTLPLHKGWRAGSESCSEADLLFHLLAAKVGMGLKLDGTSGTGIFSEDEAQKFLEQETLSATLLDHGSSSVRNAALSILTVHLTMGRPLTNNTLMRLKSTIPYFHQETAPKARNEFIAEMKKFCKRIEAIARAVPECYATTVAPSQATEVELDMGLAPKDNGDNLQGHTEFMQWYADFLFKELRPTASYQSHITALSILLHLLVTDSFLFDARVALAPKQYISSQYQRAIALLSKPLLEMLFDPFDDVRRISAAALEYILEFGPREGASDGKDVQRCYGIANHLTIVGPIAGSIQPARALFQRSGRAHHADGLGRLLALSHSATKLSAVPHNQRWTWKLLESELEQDVCAARDDLDYAILSIPIHGHLIALRYIISRTLISDLLDASEYDTSVALSQKLPDICRQIWAFVRPLLCADAPEGLNPYSEAISDAHDGVKERLSFCWRALKESSLLMNAIISRFDLESKLWQKDLNRDIHRQLGDLAFQQLAELRHRGAFSTVSQTFASWCVSCINSSIPGIAALPKMFYHVRPAPQTIAGTLACIQQKASAITRRSAGLPSMITGVLSAYPSGDLFNEVVLEMQAIAGEPIDNATEGDAVQLPQVHALNCLKDIFTDTKFGSSSEQHMADTLQMAVACLDCQIWAIRNCGLMLIKALLNRIEGGRNISSTRTSSSNRAFSRLTYDTFTNLPDLTLGLLCSDLTDSGRSNGAGGALQAQKVFPALEVVERFGLPVKYRARIMEAMVYHLEGPVWALRDKAAKALSLIAEESELLNLMSGLLSKDWSSQNALHGRLLHLRWLLGRFGLLIFTARNDMATALLSLLDDAFNNMALCNPCPFTSAAYLDVVADLVDIASRANSDAMILFVRKHSAEVGPEQAVNQKARPNGSSLFEISIKRCQRVFRSYLLPEADVRRASPDLQELAWPLEGPQQQDKNIRFLGLGVRTKLAQAPGSSKPLADLAAWTRCLILAGKEQSDVPTRLASVCSMNNFFETPIASSRVRVSSAEMLQVYLALYDTLIDDDEEVREEGAKVVSSLSFVRHRESGNNIGIYGLSPPAAKKALQLYLVREYRQSSEFWAEACLRLTGLIAHLEISAKVPGPDHDTLGTGGQPLHYQIKVLKENSVYQLYEEATRQQNVVFEEEKQNLYMDPGREAQVWADVLCRLQLSICPINDLVPYLRAWTISGMRFFEGVFENIDKGESSPTNSVLGVSSKADVYALIYRVVLATKVIIHHQERGFWGGSSGKAVSLAQLRRLLDTGKKAQLHDLLLHEMDEICKS
ncbi:MAG: hypothetical protein Q9163_002437 [Psora crenata]